MTALLRWWWAAPIAVLLIWAMLERIGRQDIRRTLANEREAWTAALHAADLQRSDIERRNAMQMAQAAAAYADRVSAREPIIVRSTNTVGEYAQSDAGRAVCLDADRVRGVDALAAELSDAAAPADGGGDAM